MPLMRLYQLLLVTFCAFSLACARRDGLFPDPEELPYRLERVANLGENCFIVDLDCDGRDEILSKHTQLRPPQDNYVVLHTLDGNTIDQVNYRGEIRSIHFLDYDSDGKKEILVALLRNDSLFVSFANAQAQKLFHFFLIAGKPRQEESGLMPWDPAADFYLADADADGRVELVTIVGTSFARLPRGVLVHSLPEGRLIGSKIVGARLQRSFLADFDSDGRLEIVAGTSAPNNGAVAGGFDDQHSYVIVFTLNPMPEVITSRQTGGLWTSPALFYEDFDGDGRREFLAVTWTHSSRPEWLRLELIEPGTWRVYRKRFVNEPLVSPVVADLDHDLRPEILVARPDGEIWVFNGGLELIKRRQVVRGLAQLEVLPDVDGDGVDEIVAGCPEGALLLDPNLGVKAALPGEAVVAVIRRGLGVPPFLATAQGVTQSSALLVKNRFYLVNRYGPAALWVLGAGLAVGAGLIVHTLRRRHRLLAAVQALAMDTDDRGLVLLRPDQRIEMINMTMRQWLGLGDKQIKHGDLSGAIAAWPALTSFVQEATALPAHRREAILRLEVHGRPRPVRAVVDPIQLNRKGSPHWLVTIEDRSLDTEFERAKAWAVMAQRVAHDVRNPLTSILLTLQRLQMEYRAKTPGHSDNFDAYTARIQERIEFLRRMARNFMKFVNVEKLNLVEACLNALVQQASATIGHGLPPDIHLELKLCPELPRVHLDHEQMQSVLENLVANAINAMPEGGKITISTQLAHGLQFVRDTDGPRDYVELEVLDTGVGIPQSGRERLFEPDFTGQSLAGASANATGSGLAIVKKIIEDHRGYIEVESESGSGSAFCIYLPAAT